jgi:CHASE2 domain-containing sensor protein
MHQALVLGNGFALVAFPLYVLVGVAAVLIMRALNGTRQGNAWYWLFNALFMFGLAGWNMWTMEPGGLNVVATTALVGLFVFGMCCLLIAWRRWQEQRSTDHG